MALSKEQLEDLYNKYVQNQCTQEELQALINELGESEGTENEETITRLFDRTWDGLEVFPDKYKLPDLSLPESNDYESPVIEMYSSKRRWMRIAAAASILLLITAGAYWLMVRTPKTDLATTNNKPGDTTDVQPGGNKAILTLADNSTIILDSAANGTLAKQGGSVVSKTKDGELEYKKATGNGQSAIVTYNTLSTPRGGQYQLVLPDGSKVWLNAASSVRYPTAFTGNERRVEITGEAYFEVNKVFDEKGHKKTFAVDFHPSTGGAGGGRVEVLGTHFNINAYDDEPAIKTTLLEGSVKVSKDAASALLKPGQQASLSQSSQKSQTIPVQTVDVEEAIAWKEGLFYFDNADIQTIMRQVARWYDVQVVYEGKIPSGHYRGKPSMNLTAVQMLKIVEYSGVKFRIENKKIIISE